MAQDFLKFAILGLGAGAVYGLTALGVVLIYRGSGVLNFAQGAVGMIGVFYFYNARGSGTSTPVAWVEAVGLGVLIGVLVHLLVMRPLRSAPALSRTIATLGLLTVLLGYAQDHYGDRTAIVPKLLPLDGVEVLPDISIGKDRLIILGIGVFLTVALTLLYRYTRFGLATSAVAQSRRATAAQGISPDLVAAVNWGLGSGLAVLGAILIVNIAQLQVVPLTLLVVPAFAAALVGGFRSFTLTFAGGLLIGFLESEVQWLQSYLTKELGHPFTLEGWTQSIPFLVIIIVLVVRGRALPLRGEATERPPEVGTGRIRPLVLLPVVAIVVVATAAVLSTDLVEAVTTTSILAIVVLSLVVVTGYAGQLSLAQFAFAGMGAWFAVQSVVELGFPFELAFVAGVVCAIPVGLARRAPVAATLAASTSLSRRWASRSIIQAQVLANSQRTGGLIGLEIGAPHFFGVDFDTFAHPERYAILVVRLLRRGRVARREPAAGACRAPPRRGADERTCRRVARHRDLRGEAVRVRTRGGYRGRGRRPPRLPPPERRVLPDVLDLRVDLRRRVRRDRRHRLRLRVRARREPRAVRDRQPVDRRRRQRRRRAHRPRCRAHTRAAAHPQRSREPAPAQPPDPLARARIDQREERRHAVLPLPEVERPVVPAMTLDVEDVSVRFGGVAALKGVSLSLRPGEVTGLIGPNGAGKTTMIDAITGFVTAASGTITLNGQVISRWSPRRRAAAGLGRSFQSLELFESMTVRDNLRTAADRRDARAYLTDLVRPGHAPLPAGAIAAVREFGLEADLDRRPEELPYGTRRLVAIARAVATSPSVLLLDEPAAGLDETETAELGRLVRRLAKEWGIAVLLVEHDVSLVFDVCDRVTVLDFGTRIAEGTPDVVRSTPEVIDAYLGAPPAEPAEPTEPALPLEPVETAEVVGVIEVVEVVEVVERVDAVASRARPERAAPAPRGAGALVRVRRPGGGPRPRHRDLPWRGRRAPGTQRRGQEHDAADPGRRARPARGRGALAGCAGLCQAGAAAPAGETGHGLRPGGARDHHHAHDRGQPAARRAARCRTRWTSSPSSSRCSAAAPGCSRVASTRCSPSPAPSHQSRGSCSPTSCPSASPRSSSGACWTRCAPRRTAGSASCSSSSTRRAALGIADRVYVMRRGRIELAETAEALLGRFDRVEDVYLSGVAAAVAPDGPAATD